MRDFSFGEFAKGMFIFYIVAISLIFTIMDIAETRSYVVSVFAILFIVINLFQFAKYKGTFIYRIKMSVVLNKEPIMIYLGLAGFAMGFLSDSNEPFILAIFLSCAMLNLKYIIMHFQLASKLKAEAK